MVFLMRDKSHYSELYTFPKVRGHLSIRESLDTLNGRVVNIFVVNGKADGKVWKASRWLIFDEKNALCHKQDPSLEFCSLEHSCYLWLPIC